MLHILIIIRYINWYWIVYNLGLGTVLLRSLVKQTALLFQIQQKLVIGACLL